MNDEDCPTESDVTHMNRDIYIKHYGSRDDFDISLVRDAIEIVFCTMYAMDNKKLQEYFSELSDKINAELCQDNPDLQLCRLSTAAWHAYFRAATEDRGAYGRSLKDAVIAQLERDLSRQLNKKELFVFAIMQELDFIEILETMPPVLNYPCWGHLGPDQIYKRTANEPY